MADRVTRCGGFWLGILEFSEIFLIGFDDGLADPLQRIFGIAGGIGVDLNRGRNDYADRAWPDALEYWCRRPLIF